VNNIGSTFSSALIVDDEKDICFLLNSILRQRNIETRLAGSLAEAEKLIEKQAPSVIFLDNHLPDGHGIEQISRFKKLLPETRIIMITAHDNPAERKRAYQEGVDFFISKPFKKDTIIKSLEQFEKGLIVE
jgi:DNA-binding NtrC family response regulator